MDPDKDVIDFKPNPLFAMKKELKEETGIGRNLCLRYQLYRFRRWRSTLLGFCYKVNYTFQEITKEGAREKQVKKMEEFNLIQWEYKISWQAITKDNSTYYCKYTNVLSALSK